MDLHIRKIEIDDFNKNYIELLSQSYEISNENITFNNFKEYLDNLQDNYNIYVVEKDGKIISSITLIIETKIIHNFGKVGHIEDLIVHKDYRNNNIGKILCNFCINKSKIYNCYKVILNCNNYTIGFYEKINFIKSGNLMSIYF